MKALVCGWFSFPAMGATAGDLMARDLVVEWLASASIAADVATAPPFTDGMDWREVDSSAYQVLVFVCGPFGASEDVLALLDKFAAATKVGINLSMLHDLSEWNPFDVLLARDSSASAHADITFGTKPSPVPVVGSVLVAPQAEYGDRCLHGRANELIDAVLLGADVAPLRVDTRLDVPNFGGLRSPAAVESMLARVDAVLTTRLHGTVLSLKNGVPVVAIDPIRGGQKVKRQCETIGWPAVLLAEDATESSIGEALDWALSAAGRAEAKRCAARGRAMVEASRARLLADLNGVLGARS